MTKSATTAITAAILIAGGGSVYLIYQNNQKTSERITALRSEIDNNRQPPPISGGLPASPKSTSGSLRSGLSASAQLARWRKLYEVGPANMAEAQTYMQDLNDLDAEALVALLLDVAGYAGKAFENWLAQDPAAAHAWYLRAVESGELTPKIIPPDGQDRWAPDRRFSQIRFAALLQSNLPEAEMHTTLRL